MKVATPLQTKSRAAVLVDRVRAILPRKPDTISCYSCRRECEADRERCPTCKAPLRLRAAM